jgi:hypothetical protein
VRAPTRPTYHRARIRIHTPLDFLVVSDHGEYMGVMPKLFEGDPLVADTALGKRLVKLAAEGKEMEGFALLIEQVNESRPDPEFNSEEVRRTVWNEIMEAGERYYEPGRFTTFLGWEWTSTPGGANLHRVVFMREGKQAGERFLPYTSFDSARPEDLWTWLDETSNEAQATFVAIPHNSNISAGLMFPTQDSEGKPITAEYARTRMRWEPVVEVTQIRPPDRGRGARR